MTYMKSNPKGLLALADFVEHGRADAEMMRTVANYSSPLPKLSGSAPALTVSTFISRRKVAYLHLHLESSSEILVVNLRTGEKPL